MNALRSLRRQPGFFALAMVLLASGLAAATVIFTIADALLWRALPVQEPERLVRIVTVRAPLGVRSLFRPALYDAFRREASSFAAVGAAQDHSVSYRDGDRTERVLAGVTTPEWFTTFGLTASAFAPGDDRSALLSHAFWRRRYDSRPDAIGRQVLIHGVPFTIAGVLPAGFNGATVESGPDVRIPRAAIARYPANPVIAPDMDFELVARLKPGVSREAARDEAYRIYTAHADAERDLLLTPREFDLEPLAHGASRLRPQAEGAVWFASMAAGLLALMVCVNLSGLLLARAVGRAPEFAVRQALGATRRQLAGMMLGEAALVVTGALALAAGLTLAGLRWVAAALPPVRLLGRTTAPMALQLEPDWRVFAFGAALCAVALCVIASAPAWQAARLRSTRVTAGGRRWLLTAQVALCTILLLAAALVQGTLDGLRQGEKAAALVSADVDRLLAPGMDHLRFAQAMEQWIGKVRALPGVRQAAFSVIRRLRGSGLKMTIVPEGESATARQFLNSSTLPVGAGYFAVNHLGVLAGRVLTEAEHRDTKASPQPVVASEAFARMHGGAAAIVGRRFGSSFPGKPATGDMVVVGVVANAKYRSLREEDPPVVYNAMAPNWSTRTLMVESDLSAAALAPVLRAKLREAAPELTLEEVAALHQDVEASLWNERAVAALSAAFAALATVIVAAGLFAFVAYLVAARRREVGIRLAIGARPRDVLQLVLAQGLMPVAVGVALGLLGGWWLGRLAQAFLFGVRPHEPLIAAGVTAAMLLVGLAACLTPAWRASRTDPALALRAE